MPDVVFLQVCVWKKLGYNSSTWRVYENGGGRVIVGNVGMGGVECSEVAWRWRGVWEESRGRRAMKTRVRGGSEFHIFPIYRSEVFGANGLEIGKRTRRYTT
jgi:hypothetical protein